MPEAIPLPVVPPFQLDVTVGLLRRRPANQIDAWDGEWYQRAMATPDGVQLAAVTNTGSREAPNVQLTISGGPFQTSTQAALVAKVRDMLGLDLAPPPLHDLAQIYPTLGPLASRLAGLRPPVFPSLFEASTAVLPFQQLSLDAGVAILNRLAERFGPSLAIDGTVHHGLPTPASILAASENELREAGLSRTKAMTLQTLAGHAEEGFLTRSHLAPLATAEAARQLQSIRGIGPWSAGLILLRGLRRMDIFPPGDVGAAKGLVRLLALPSAITPAEAVSIASAAGPLQGYLYFLCLGQWLVEHSHCD